MGMIANLRTVIILLSAPLATALGKGEFCFFLAPNEAANLGHIGWGFQIPGNVELYQYGGTEDVNFGDTWTSQGTKQQMLDAFPGWVYQRWGNDYQVYKCMSTDTSAVAEAEKVVQYQQTKANVYDLVTNNCLTQSLNIAEKYAEYDITTKIEDEALMAPYGEGLIVPDVFFAYVPVDEQNLPGK
jgi:hypothetical protein